MSIDVESRTPRTATVVASSTNIPTGFSTASGSRIFTDITAAQNLYINNGASTALQVNVTAGSSTAPSTVELTVPASVAVTFNNIKLSSSLYLQSAGAAISSGTVIIDVW